MNTNKLSDQTKAVLHCFTSVDPDITPNEAADVLIAIGFTYLQFYFHPDIDLESLDEIIEDNPNFQEAVDMYNNMQ